MAITEFYQAGGSDLNSGSTSGAAAAFTSTAGNWSTVTGIFTPTDGSTPASSVNVGDYVSLYLNAASATVSVGLVSAVGAGVNGTITVGTTAVFGTYPVTGSGTVSLKAGGAWNSCAVWTSLFPAQTTTISMRLNLKAATLANAGTSRTFGLAATATLAVIIRGYKTTIGDQLGNTQAVDGTDIPLITFTTGAMGNAARQEWQNVSVQGATATALWVINATTTMNQVRVTNTNTTSTATCLSNSGNVPLMAIGCKFTGTTTNTRTILNSGTGFWSFRGCTITSGIVGIDSSSTGSVLNVDKSMLDSQQGDGIKSGGSTLNISQTGFYGQTGNGINVTVTPVSFCAISNCAFEAITTAAKAAIMNSSGTATDLIKPIANGFFNCTANYSGLADGGLLYSDNGTLAASPFVSPSTQNFAPSATAQGIGFPGQIEGVSTYQSYPDIGVAQHQGSGSTYIFQVEG